MLDLVDQDELSYWSKECVLVYPKAERRDWIRNGEGELQRSSRVFLLRSTPSLSAKGTLRKGLRTEVEEAWNIRAISHLRMYLDMKSSKISWSSTLVAVRKVCFPLRPSGPASIDAKVQCYHCDFFLLSNRESLSVHNTLNVTFADEKVAAFPPLPDEKGTFVP